MLELDTNQGLAFLKTLSSHHARNPSESQVFVIDWYLSTEGDC